MSGAAADADHTWFGEFATTLVKENLFLLDDALGRLADVKKREAEKADEAAWNAQPAHLRRDREARLDSVRRTAKSFLDLGKASLSALLLLTSEPLVGTAFTHVPQRAHKMGGLQQEQTQIEVVAPGRLESVASMRAQYATHASATSSSVQACGASASATSSSSSRKNWSASG